MLCNWDAEEYGLVGSTEWVEVSLSSKLLLFVLSVTMSSLNFVT